MDTGVAIFPTQYSIGPGALAALVEEHGQGSLWFPEHTHIPASRDTPPPSGGELPPRYSHSLDLFVAMTAAATATRRLRIGAGICLVVERDPIITAKEVATIDQLSGGRVEFGVGAGWNREEMANHGTDPKRRFGLMRERVEAIREERFLILPHPEVGTYMAHRGGDHERWLRGMRRLQGHLGV